MENQNKLAESVRSHQQVILNEWIDTQLASPTLRLDLMKESELRDESREFLTLFSHALFGRPRRISSRRQPDHVHRKDSVRPKLPHLFIR